MEAKVFSQNTQGVKIHWTITGDTVPELTINIGDLIDWLDVNKFQADTGFGNGSSTVARPAPTKKAPTRKVSNRTPPADDVPECDFCGGPVWDNRNNKRNPKGPDFKCKDKECGGAAWENEDGLNWSQ